MIDTSPATLAAFIGIIAGVIGVGVAVYLQMVDIRRCPLRYVVGYFLFGSALILINVAAVSPHEIPFGLWFPVVGNAVLLLFELATVPYVLDHLGEPVENPIGYLWPFDRPQ